MGARPARRGMSALLLALVLLCAVPALAAASHEKGGFADIAVSAGGMLSGHVGLVHTNPGGTCPANPGYLFLSGHAITITGPSLSTTDTLGGVTVDCTPTSLAETGSFSRDVSAGGDGLYQVSFSDCCRVAGIANTSSQNTVFSAGVVKHAGVAAGSPVLSSKVSLGVSTQAGYSQNLNASDPDGGTLTYTLMQSADSSAPGYDVESPATNLPAVDASGLVTIAAPLTASLAVPSYYVMKVRVDDPDGGYAMRDLLLQTSTNRPPLLAGSLWRIQVVAGDTASDTFASTDPDTGQQVSFDPSGLPAWASMSSSSGNPATATLTVSPPAGTPIGTTGVNIDAIDDDPSVTMRTSRRLLIDVLPSWPTVTPTAPPSGTSANASPALGATATDGADAECSLDGGAWTSCSTAAQPSTPLADGTHTLQMRPVLVGGARGPASAYSWTVDTTPPAAPHVVSAPTGVVPKGTSAQVTVSGSEPQGHFECALDHGIWMTCGATETLTGLTPGAHELLVREVDAAGNAGPGALVAFSVGDTPDPPPTQTPSRVQLDAPKALQVDGGGIELGCAIDAGTLERCDVRAYVKVGRRKVLVGKGRTTTPPDGGGQSASVKVVLNGHGRALTCQAGGVRVQFDITAIAREGGQVKTSKAARVRTPRLVVVPSDGMFAIGSAGLLPKGARALLKTARRLRGVPHVRCTGHTDSTGSAWANQRLGLSRAKTVCHYLRSHGVRAPMNIASAGERRPRATNATASGRAKNRRVEIAVRCGGVASRSSRRHG